MLMTNAIPQLLMAFKNIFCTQGIIMQLDMEDVS